MAAAIVQRSDSGFTVQIEIPSKSSMLEAEEAIQQALNQAGVAATAEVLRQFDTDGRPIRLGATKLTSMGRFREGAGQHATVRAAARDSHLNRMEKWGCGLFATLAAPCPFRANAPRARKHEALSDALLRRVPAEVAAGGGGRRPDPRL